MLFIPNQNNLSIELLERYVGFYCAPVMLGLKSANTVKVPTILKDKFEELILMIGLSYELLYDIKNKSYYCIYQPDLLYQALEKKDAFLLLKQIGYSNLTMEDTFQQIKDRFQDYFLQKAEYPHEIGLFLDYPVYDVIGFVEFQGKNYLYCGYWKVYRNVKSAKKLFLCYDQARDEVLTRLRKGARLEQITKKRVIIKK